MIPWICRNCQNNVRKENRALKKLVNGALRQPFSSFEEIFLAMLLVTKALRRGGGAKSLDENSH